MGPPSKTVFTKAAFDCCLKTGPGRPGIISYWDWIMDILVTGLGQVTLVKNSMSVQSGAFIPAGYPLNFYHYLSTCGGFLILNAY